MKHSAPEISIQTSFVSSIVIDLCLPLLKYQESRLRACFAIPDTFERRRKKSPVESQKSRNRRTTRRICKPLTCYPFTFFDNRRAPRRVLSSSSSSFFFHEEPLCPLNSTAYNRRRTYVCSNAGWDNRAPFSPESRKGERGYNVATQIRAKSKDSRDQDGRPIPKEMGIARWKQRGGNHAIHSFLPFLSIDSGDALWLRYALSLSYLRSSCGEVPLSRCFTCVMCLENDQSGQ